MAIRNIRTSKTDGRPATTVTKTVPATSGLSATARNSKSASDLAINIMYISNRRDASTTRAKLPAVGKSTITGDTNIAEKTAAAGCHQQYLQQ